MSKIKSKTQKDMLIKTMKLVDESFRQYFYEYYQTHSEIKNISYYTMKEDTGFSAIIEYENFRQYINFYYSNIIISENAFINSCFEFEYNNTKFLCHFDDILDSIDSDGYYSEYSEDAYAFNINGEWYEYGVPYDEETAKLIQDNIAKYDKQLKTVESIEDFE